LCEICATQNKGYEPRRIKLSKAFTDAARLRIFRRHDLQIGAWAEAQQGVTSPESRVRPAAFRRGAKQIFNLGASSPKIRNTPNEMINLSHHSLRLDASRVE